MPNLTSHSSFTQLDEWLFYLESIHATEIDMGLTRIGNVVKKLDINLKPSKVITVAGTNGKGTTCAFLENALLQQGKSVAVYSSPHIEKFNERLRINKKLISDQPLIDAFKKIELKRQDISLTYYEYTTLAALIICQQLKPDYIILEVGLGGRLDATNIIDSDLAVITSIDIDHQAFLGDTRELIGYEKAGIVRANCPVVIGDLDVPKSVLEHCRKVAAKPFIRNEEFHLSANSSQHAFSNDWQWQSANTELSMLPATKIPQDNVATALMTLELLGLPLEQSTVSQWINATQLEGRTEIVKQNPLVVVDVAHNPHAAEYLQRYVSAHKQGKVHAVVAMLADKDISGTIATMLPVVDDWYVASLSVPRGASKQILSNILAQNNIIANSFDKVSDAYKIALDKANNNDMILVFGSFFTVANIKKSEF